jgi:small GTP-binding protein
MSELDSDYRTSRTHLQALQRIKEAQENGAEALDLTDALFNNSNFDPWGWGLYDLPPEIFELPQLKSLDLARNSIRSLPESISQLRRLTSLNLSGNSLSALPESFAQLQNLISLDLSGNHLTTLPESVTRLRNLNSLNVSGNLLNSLPESIGQLRNLTSLNVSNTSLRALSESIGKLENLKSLNVSFNPIRALPESIGNLQSLTSLNLTQTSLRALPESISRLQNLTSLDLTRNALNAFPESITQLRSLTSLNLSFNPIRALPESIIQLQNLASLDLTVTLLRTLPSSITRLPNLASLTLTGNLLTTLPEAIVLLRSLTSLDLTRNPLDHPPIEIAEKGIDAIREYFRQIRQEGVDHLYEAKLLILGEGGAGKTTLANKVLDSKYELREEDSTKGVDVLQWSFPMEGNRQFRVNIWDFGGQEIYHATHQFFLTRRSLYILVADTRKDDTDFYYWLNVAELLSDNSPLLIVKNEKQDRHREINERELRQFDNLKEVLATNLATNRDLEKVKEAIKYHMQRLPHVGSQLPKTWVRVRERLEKDPRNYISLKEYFSICDQNGFTDVKDALQLSGYLNDIGVFLHFQDEPLLKRIVILKPKWGTDAVYKVLDNKTVIKNLGRFTRADLERIWDMPEYEDMREELLQLMMKFRLCYEIPTHKGTYVAPQLLTENQPDYEWVTRNNLLLRYTYEFMPKGILMQLVVAMHPDILGQRVVWKSGVVIEKEATRAEVIEYYGKREIHVRIAGPQARDLATVIRHQLNQIHDTYRRLKYDELVPCNCPVCKDSQEPHFYPVAKIIEFRANNQFEIQCQNKPYHMVNVMRLLGDFFDLSKPPEQDARRPVHVQVEYIEGDKTVTEIHQNIEGSTVHGSVVAAETIKDSFNVIEKAEIQIELKEQLRQLARAVEAMAKELPKEGAEEVADDMKRLAEEASKLKPNPKWYNVSIDGLIAAAQNLGKVGDAVIELAGKVRKILTGGLL